MNFIRRIIIGWKLVSAVPPFISRLDDFLVSIRDLVHRNPEILQDHQSMELELRKVQRLYRRLKK